MIIPLYWKCNGVLGYSDLLGMQWRSRQFRSVGMFLAIPIYWHCAFSAIPIYWEWAFPMNGFWISPNTRDFWLNGLGPHEIPLHKFTRLQPVANFIFISKNIFQCFNSIGPNKTQKLQKNWKTVFYSQ